MTREDPKKVAERVRRYRANTPTERLEIIGVTAEQKERFRSLPDLEDLKAADRLQVLMECWMERHSQAKPAVVQVTPVAPVIAPVAEDLNLSRRREIDKRFKESGSFILPRETARSRFWQRHLKEEPETLAAVRTLNQHVHPEFSTYLKKNVISITPSQLKIVASFEPILMLELAHLVICKGGRDPIDALDARLDELKHAHR